VNAWRHRINTEFSGDCCLLPSPRAGISTAPFWLCPTARRMWNWVMSLVNKMRTRRSYPGPWHAFDMKTVIFSEKVPARYAKFKSIWVLLKGACLWALWCQRNDKIFAGKVWSDDTVIRHIWNAMIEYGHSAWNKTLKECTRCPLKAQGLMKRFDRTWLARGVLGRRHSTMV
jgi:hypothetical protein